ncbi:deoxyribonuclease, TatD family [Treponema primitia ZAS-2]|uniref:Deoxyribonuclease, TatD family n=1 Tax=Treponema primitia (strain ATCC BAA-887 / DSM 12427 / ZAS-2) TaxID=545694 RepID=F5YIU8_TREPZ|nr:TatD family hydrolase [Treponema primitia]AEF85723.1 deoxyribonuclease, TatD family [Treponema primitia ZAS-2]
MSIPELPADKPLLIDSHAHLSMLDKLDLPAQKGPIIDTETRIRELFAGGFGGIIDIGTEADDLSGRIGAFSRFERVRFSGGLWPTPEAIAGRGELVPQLEACIAAAPPGLVLAVGECGLDHHQELPPGTELDKAGEEELLEMLLDLAKRRNLPIIIHSRDAPKETAAILARRPDVIGVIHCFSYGKEEVRTFLDLGYYISFAGNLTYKNAPNLREALPFVPQDRLLLETDSPWLAPVPHRGKAADPGMVAENYTLAAELRGTAIRVMGEQIAENIEKLFGFHLSRI